MIDRNKIRSNRADFVTGYSLTEQTQPQTTRVIAVTSGKGGVGKTNVVTNLAVTLAEAGEQVTILDADFGLANVDVMFGLNPQHHIGHVIFGEKQLEEVIIDGPRGVRIIPASSGVQELAELTSVQRHSLVNTLKRYYGETGWLLIDTAAGISSNVTHLIRSASEAIVVTTPEPTSIVDAYAIIKVIAAESFSKPIWLVVNHAANATEADQVANQIQTVTQQFLGREVDFLGFINRDQNVPKAVMRQQPVSLCYPESPASRCFQRLAAQLRGGEEPIAPSNVLPFLRHVLGNDNF